MFALSRKTGRNISVLAEPFDRCSPPVMIKSPEVLCNQASRARSRKHEIAFLIRSDVDTPPRKKTKFQADFDSFTTNSSLVSLKESVPLPILSPLRALPKTSSNKDLLTQQSHISQVRCSECAYTSYKSIDVVAHARLAHPSKPFACNICGRCFTEKGNLNKHHRTVHLRERKHSCKHCSRSFAFLDGLNRHISMVHLDRRPFKCTVCLCPGRHANEEFCPFTCGMRFKQKSHYRRHVRSVHHVELPTSQ